MSKPKTIERCVYLISGSYVVKKRGKWSKPFKTVEKAREERDKIERTQAPKPLGGQMAQFYYETYFPMCMEGTLRTNTIGTWKSCYTKIILPYFENKYLGDITTEDCLAFRSHLQGCGRYVAKSINFQMWLLSNLFEKAIDMDRIEKNPCKKIKQLKEIKKDRPTLTPPQLVELINRIKHDHPYKYAIAIAGLAGARQGEVMGFRWEDFDFSGNGTGHITFKRTINRGHEVDVLKTNHQYDTIPMTKTLTTFLREWKEKCPDDTWLFQGKVRNHIAKIKRDGFKYHRTPATSKYEYTAPASLCAWWTIRVRPQFDFIDPKMRFHDLKHSYATNVVESCNNIKKVQRLCRHADVHTTLQIYAHVRPEELEEEVENWEW